MNTSMTVLEQDIPQQKIDLIKQTVARGTTDLEFELFLHACKRTGLDPLMKQIYAIKRLNRKTNKEEMSIQTGIDGYRLIADRTGGYAGSDEPTYIIADDKLPDVASVTVYKLVGGIRCPFSSSARWAEYYSESSPMWKKMPFLMLGKCAEALALRKAFPAELSGVYTHEEMDQAENEPRATVPTMATLQDSSLKVVQEKLQAAKVQPPAQASGSAKRTPLLWNDLADAYDMNHAGSKARTLPMERVSAWACSRPDLFDGGEDGSFYLKPLPTPDPAPAQESAFIWQVGKYKGKNIEEIELSYLEFYISDKNTYSKKADHVAAAKSELERVAGEAAGGEKTPVISALCSAYLENITASETVTECDKSLADALTDEHITEPFERQHLIDTAGRKMAQLRQG